MKRFWDLLERSIIVQGLVTLAVTVVACVLWLNGSGVPDTLQVVLGAVYGFWFGTYTQKTTATVIRDELQKMQRGG